MCNMDSLGKSHSLPEQYGIIEGRPVERVVPTRTLVVFMSHSAVQRLAKTCSKTIRPGGAAKTSSSMFQVL